MRSLILIALVCLCGCSSGPEAVTTPAAPEVFRVKFDTSKGVFVVLHPNAERTAEAMETYCRGHLAAYKVPRQIELAAELPKSATGKILKRVLRARATPAETVV